MKTKLPLDKDGQRDTSKGTVSWICQDGGLWQVFFVGKDWASCEQPETIGWVWNHGYTPEERIGEPYRALDAWVDGVKPGNEYGRSGTLRGAINILIFVNIR